MEDQSRVPEYGFFIYLEPAGSINDGIAFKPIKHT
jgi:hypothetical protein